ncbi:ornithine carbamoyltransferase [Paraburkholderia sp. NMBU_R16]|uniref:ornithine carbamoyltransferase n=1 Tax=Paraburkholderia sp. NMBU_R16 TaxID=2698676 RepID=UPI001564C42D|nr:ornithine carbamoyltransferase [Paraburkholderia sp. NMBU_R16]NRO98545.1 ornithine carbamoyltransferase [Paraburkholderia sp. NMBU_R16]
MSSNFRSIVELTDVGADNLMWLLARAAEMAQLWRERRMPQSLSGKRLALVVNDSGWRNTTAFDLGIQTMGGISVQPPLRWDTREDLRDLAAYVGNWFDAIITRASELSVLRTLAEAFDGPVINARTRQNHPCEVLGDLAFFFRKNRAIDGIKVTVISPKSNILGSWIEAAAVLPIEVVQIFPVKWHDHRSVEAIPRFSRSSDIKAIEGSNIVITDCWPENGDEAELIEYQITNRILDTLPDDVEFIPCPPVHRGKEVSFEAMEHSACRVIQAKEFLMHAQNAALEWVFRVG